MLSFTIEFTVIALERLKGLFYDQSHRHAESTISTMKTFSWISLVLTACVLPFSAQGPSLAVANPESAVTSVTNGFITAVLRSECTDAPIPPPPVGEIAVGPDYVIMTVADGDPLDYEAAQQFATDAVFESLMPFYCALAQNPTRDR